MHRGAFLVGTRIYLRSLERADAQGNYVRWFNDEEACKNNSHHVFPYSEEQAVKYIEYADNTKDSLILAVETIDNSEHIGNISLLNINLMHRTAELAIMIGEKAYWGKGYAKEAMKLMIDHGFRSLNLTRVGLGTFHTNISMQKLAESLGFVQEGRRRSAFFKDNANIDVIEYGMLKNEWNLEVEVKS